MLRQLFMWALTCTAAPFMCALAAPQAPMNEPDSLEVLLDEVTVAAKNVIDKTDGKIIIPPKSKTDASTSGLDLLQKLALPGLIVNRLTGSIHLSGGGVLKLYIDGIPATEGQISALDPKKILRIEYHDNPGVKYGNADAAIDCIMRQTDSGGRLYVESMDCIGDGKFATLDQLAAQFFNGRSSLSVDAGYMQMSRNNWIRDYEEIWRYPDHEVVRTEKGMPVKAASAGLRSNISYRYDHDDSNRYSLRFSFDHDNVPNKEEGDRHSLLTTSAAQGVTEIREHTAERSLQPSLALNYRHIFRKAGTLTFNIEGSWLGSDAVHDYSEKTEGSEPYVISTETEGSRYGILMEGMHEISLGPGTLTSAISHTASRTSNRYRTLSDNNVTTTDIDLSESYASSEYSVAAANWGFAGGLTAKRLYASQCGVSRSKYVLLPSVSISYKPGSDIFLRYAFHLGHKLPPLAAMSDISQEIQPGMVRHGNPEVKSFFTSDQEFSFAYSNRFVSADLTVGYLSESNPVMNSVLYDDGIFVQTYANQKYFRKLHVEAMIAVSPWKDHISVWVSPVFSRYFSRGRNYDLAKNIFRIHFGVDASYTHFVFTASTMSGAANYMYGDEIITEKPMNMILAGYKAANWSLQGGVMNLMRNYWMKTENFSPLTPFKSDAHCGKNVYFTVKLSVNLNYGKKKDRQEEIRASHLDMDSGIVNGLK